MSEDSNRSQHGQKIVHGRICAIRLRDYLTDSSVFIVTKMLLSLKDLNLFKEAYSNAKKKHKKSIKEELLKRKDSLENELNRLDESF